VVGDAALLIDPHEPGQIAAALRRVLDDAALRAELCARSLAQAAHFSWDQTAAATLAAYRG
jgi:glycosyltransferase involved in cell wall biosynthesis